MSELKATLTAEIGDMIMKLKKLVDDWKITEALHILYSIGASAEALFVLNKEQQWLDTQRQNLSKLKTLRPIVLLFSFWSKAREFVRSFEIPTFSNVNKILSLAIKLKFLVDEGVLDDTFVVDEKRFKQLTELKESVKMKGGEK